MALADHLPAWRGLRDDLAASPVDGEALYDLTRQALGQLKHGDLPAWLAALERLPSVAVRQALDRPDPRLGAAAPDPASLKETLMALHPWRKGPLTLGGVTIDTEWRSDWKWARLAPHVDLEGATVLDVGCGNGYFGWRMLGQGARSVVGIDPTLLFVLQWLAQVHFAGPAPSYVLPLRDTDLPRDVGTFDCVFSLGVLYHRRDPGDHLGRLRDWLAPGGQLVLETLIVDGGQTLTPAGRYARMRNVHEVPTVERLLERVAAAGFVDATVVDRTRTTIGEQRTTDWMRFQSLAECLDPADPTRTVEGHPAPLRAIVVARAPDRVTGARRA